MKAHSHLCFCVIFSRPTCSCAYTHIRCVCGGIGPSGLGNEWTRWWWSVVLCLFEYESILSFSTFVYRIVRVLSDWAEYGERPWHMQTQANEGHGGKRIESLLLSDSKSDSKSAAEGSYKLEETSLKRNNRTGMYYLMIYKLWDLIVLPLCGFLKIFKKTETTTTWILDL